jgi:FkbM family methyltransferase
MVKISISEFVPPIYYRIVNFIDRRLKQYKNEVIRLAPFNSIPKNVNVKWVLDVGANVGDVAVNALKGYPSAQVICFEPVQATCSILRERLVPYSNRAHIFNYALSDKNESGEINITTYHGANSISPQAKFHQENNPHVRELGREKIELVRLDDFSVNFPSQKIDVLKIDVEGHELSVLKGGFEFISKNVDVIIIEIALMRDQSWKNQAVFDIFSLLNEAGFCLINIMDLHHAEDSEMLLLQMDCVFRHKRQMMLG